MTVCIFFVRHFLRLNNFYNFLESNPPLFLIDPIDSDLDDLTDFGYIVHIGDAFCNSELGYMYHTLLSTSDLDDCTDRIEDLHDFSFIDVTDLDIFEDIFDEVQCRLAADLIPSRDRTGSAVFEIDLDSELFLDTLDRLTTLTDDLSHLLLGNKY